MRDALGSGGEGTALQRDQIVTKLGFAFAPLQLEDCVGNIVTIHDGIALEDAVGKDGWETW